MLNVPSAIIQLLSAFTPVFSKRVFHHVQVLLVGALLTPGRRTVTNALRVLGLQHERHFQTYHRVLNRAQWSSRAAAQILLNLLVRAFAPEGVLVLEIDETLERRQGDQIAAKGIYRDAARSSKNFFVKASGLRWISLMLLTPIPWAGRVWALPFLTVLAPSEWYATQRNRRHKKVTDWARQMVAQVRRWLPNRTLVLVADSGYAVLALLDRCARLAHPVTLITRLRLDAALYEPAPVRRSNQVGRPRRKGKRLPTLHQLVDDSATSWTSVIVPRWYSQGPRMVDIVSATCVWYHSGMPVVPIRWVLIRDPQGRFAPQALVCADVQADPVQMVSWFVLRWQLETTFQAVRTHLGVETQRQWNELAILRTTPALFGLFSIVTLLAHEHAKQDQLVVRGVRRCPAGRERRCASSMLTRWLAASTVDVAKSRSPTRSGAPTASAVFAPSYATISSPNIATATQSQSPSSVVPPSSPCILRVALDVIPCCCVHSVISHERVS